MNRVLGHMLAHMCLTGQEEPSEDDGMYEMTLPSRHKIRALVIWGRPRYLSVTEVPHII